jgi:hypothetical protein
LIALYFAAKQIGRMCDFNLFLPLAKAFIKAGQSVAAQECDATMTL